jgi:hypothetical protein
VHDGGIVVSSEDEARSTHVGSELIDLVELTIDDISAGDGIAQISYDEIVSRAWGELGKLEIGAAHPRALGSQPPHQMRTNEPSSSTN